MAFKVEAVTFDVGGTLIAPWPSVGHIYAEVAERHGYGKLAPALLNRQFATAWRAKTAFHHGRDQWRQLVREAFAGLPAPSDEFFEELYAFLALPAAWRVFDDVHQTLELLRKRGLKLAVVSNWDERLRPLLSKLELDRYFEVITVSIEVGVVKPSPEIFHDAVARLKLAPSSVLHVGDHQIEDVRGALAAGLQAAFLNRQAKEPKRSGGFATISTLTELPQ